MAMARKIKEKGRKYELLLFSLLFVFSEFFLFIYTLPTEVETPSDLLHPATAKELFTIENNVAPKHSTSFIGWSNYTAKKLFTIENNAAAKHSTSFLSSPNYTLSPIFHSPSFVRPSFKSIVEDHRHDIIVGDIQFLLDFAIIGHVKCGTSSMMEWLGTHPQIACIPGEVPLLPLGKIGLLAKRLYNGLDADPMKLRGFKNPTDIQNLKAIRLLREYFPQTKLLIGIRHPVLWFESFYNHRIQNTGEMPPPDKLMKGCFKGTQGVCGERAEFHKSLVRLGKTNYTQEKEAFTQKEWKNLLKDSPRKSPNPVFLYDTQQLADKDLARRLLFRQDMQNFLSLTEPFPELVHNSPGKSLNATEQAERDVKKLNICEEQHDEIRQTLMAKSKRSAYYIRSYFIHAPDVTVSSPDYFLEIMASYFQDPCILRNNATQ